MSNDKEVDVTGKPIVLRMNLETISFALSVTKLVLTCLQVFWIGLMGYGFVVIVGGALEGSLAQGLCGVALLVGGAIVGWCTEGVLARFKHHREKLIHLVNRVCVDTIDAKINEDDDSVSENMLDS